MHCDRAFDSQQRHGIFLVVMADDDAQRFAELWCAATLTQNVVAAAELRDDDYCSVLPNGVSITRDEELALLRSPTPRVVSMEVVKVGRRRDEASAVIACRIEMGDDESRHQRQYILDLQFRKRGDQWRAHRSTVREVKAATAAVTHGRLEVVDWLRYKMSRITPSFQELAYRPYQPRKDFVLRNSPRDTPNPDGPLPIPPPELWLGYNYLGDGKTHVDEMLRLLRLSDFSFRTGDRVLDFGCGAGRMIRHLRSLTPMCEIWGTDISATHILWCKRNLSPPFSFATTTKIPHLPFEDRSFRFIYCGSVFTHIDDLADAWLLELRRILTEDGRLYLTIHDNRTIELLEDRVEDRASWLRWITRRKTYKRSRDGFDMFTIGRDDRSQVFYDRAYFTRTLQPTFEVISTTPEAYHYQTAFLLKRATRTRSNE